MKKVLNLGEYILIFLLGYLIFVFLITVTQVIIYSVFGLLLNFCKIYMVNFQQFYIVYFIIFVICLIINIIYNFYFIKILNKSLEKVKGRRIKFEK